MCYSNIKFNEGKQRIEKCTRHLFKCFILPQSKNLIKNGENKILNKILKYKEMVNMNQKWK